MPGYVPFNYEQINIEAGTYNPSPVKAYNNRSFAFWARSLFQRALSVVEINLPDDWSGTIYDFFCYCLFKWGYLPVFELDELGKVFQPGSLGGYNFWYAPTFSVISNPVLKGKSLKLAIGDSKVDNADGVCEVLKLTPDYYGIWDIIEYYAAKLSTLDNAIDMSLINNKFAFFLGAKNKGMGEALKKMLDKINKGEPAVIYDSKMADDPTSKDVPWQFWDRDLRKSYLTTEQLADFKTLLHNFDTEIGIPTLPIEKKERMIDAEARSTDQDALSRSDVWIKTFNESAKAVNERYGLNISMRRKEVKTDGNIESDRTIQL